MAKKDHVILNRTGDKMPLVGFGLWKVDPKDAAQTVYDAIKVGYRVFDGACDYGNEKEVGQGIAKAIQDGLVKRQDLFSTLIILGLLIRPFYNSHELALQS